MTTSNKVRGRHGYSRRWPNIGLRAWTWRAWRVALPCLLLLDAPARAEADELLLTDARLTPGGATVAVHIAGDSIRAVGALEALLPGALEAERHALGGALLLPGLADMHVHLERFDDPVVLGQFLAAGVTTVRSMGGGENVRRWRAAVIAGERAGPHILVGSAIIEGRRPYWPGSHEAGTAREGRALAGRLIDLERPFLKVYHTLPGAAFAGLLAVARGARVPVVGHLPTDLRLADALDAGFASIEHLRGYGAAVSDRRAARRASRWRLDYLAVPLDPERLRAAVAATVEAGTWNCPTLAQLEQLAAPGTLNERYAEAPIDEVPAAIRESWAPAAWRPGTQRLVSTLDASEIKALAEARTNRQHLIRALADAGAPILAGSDTPVPFLAPGSGLHAELNALAEAGLSDAQVLASTTREPGRFVRRHLPGEPPFGRVAVGQRADLIVVAVNSEGLLPALRRPRAVIARGRWFGTDALAGFRAAAQRAYAPAGATPSGIAPARATLLPPRSAPAGDRGVHRGPAPEGPAPDPPRHEPGAHP